MADSTVGALTAASSLTGAELFYGVQSANDVKITASQIATFTGGGGGGMAIGGAVTSGTSGSVLYVDSGGALAQDSGLQWNATSDVLTVSGHYNIGSAIAIFTVPNVSSNNWFEGAAGTLAVTGYGNFGTGDGALASLTSGFYNTALGARSLGNMRSGDNNIAVGSDVLQASQTDTGNIGIGAIALNAMGSTLTGASGANIAIGYSSMAYATRGGPNICIGYNSLTNAHNQAFRNTIIGPNAGATLGSGGNDVTDNTFIGYGCGQLLNAGSTGNTWVGLWTGTSAQVDYTIVLSNQYFIFDCHYSKPDTYSMAFPVGRPLGMHVYNVSDATPPVNYERGIFDWNVMSNVLVVGTQAGGTGVKRLTAINGFAKAGAPAAGDLPSGSFALIDDTSGGATWLCFNKSGTIRKVQLV